MLVMSRSSKSDLPGGRLVEPQERASDRRLAASGLADETERLAAPDDEVDPVHRLDVPDVAVEHDPALDREPDSEVAHLDERCADAHAAPDRRLRAHSSAGAGWKQAARCSGPTFRRSGSAARQSSCA